ncbi:hypothetical protein BX600DRAFT_391358 [Xylariales sp. PMI_506]|nr:hypothetical protein BX600DRAFT_391358 [Xylariales sp. PMI_506]
MALPSTQKKWVILGQGRGLDGFQFTEGPVPDVDEHGVLGTYPFTVNAPVVGGSDGAGEVVEVGSKATKWKIGDRVATLFNPGHQSGPITTAAYNQGGLGGVIDGTFQEYGVFDETWLVRLAENLSFVEGATLSNAGVTAWNALYGLKPLKPGEWVLVQGTGGVSVFAVQFAKAGGAKVVATTSTPAKFELLRGMGADHVINYREDPEWGTTARKLTPNGQGFDHILDVGAAGTMTQALQAVKYEGIISVIGALSEERPKENVFAALEHICTLRGLFVGSRDMMEDMMAAIEVNKIQPVVDEHVFSLDQLKLGLERMKAQQHVGKIVIKII